MSQAATRDLPLTIDPVGFRNPDDAAALVHVLDGYARDPMGGGEPLADDVRQRLPAGLAGVPGAFAFLARLGGRPVGVAVCFMSYSTFAAAPLVNIHDVCVLAPHRGRGVATALFKRIETEARSRGACKITLEVLSGNINAKRLYKSLGYGDYTLDPEAGHALFWQKRLT
ncbi:GNAT superfamily N-acetyltransferase [Novosphingobium chloroacetimidivorans]|uniref:GNAT superfamily N-acetyltransferase n=1 Tax=Novosphingobium chloroacetimidivorans TaxID=1428314 RepID=A0A7W7K952_9SPHN|nr:GNAT family N-acetyltransferase [Novosphingobium chloroacetimidivorans]MBB4858009.1 GNAT superfamily N-acetyltransferase [Novosphingobium chloroacetimidivorans]